MGACAGRRSRLGRLGFVLMSVGVGLTLPTSAAQASTGSNGLIAVTGPAGISVFDSSGDGSDLHLLIASSPSGGVSGPAWSPTGEFLVYQHEREVWIAHADGTDPHPISSPDLYSQGAAWSPDGRLSYLAGHDIVIVDVNGTHQIVIDPSRQLRRPVDWIGPPLWTADGRIVLPLKDRDTKARGLFIADGDGTDLRPLTAPDGSTPEYPTLSYNWQFSSTGLVAYLEQVPGASPRFRENFSSFDGTHIVESPHFLESEDVALSPTGSQAVFARLGSDLDWYATEVGIWTVDLDSSAPFVRENAGFQVPEGVWGPDWQPRCSITGSEGNDELTGTPGHDLICGLGGDDVISGMRGNDVIYAGGGEDQIHGGSGNDVLRGGKDVDTILGGSERDLINSRRDAVTADIVYGGSGHNVCIHDRADVLRSC